MVNLRVNKGNFTRKYLENLKVLFDSDHVLRSNHQHWRDFFVTAHQAVVMALAQVEECR